MDVWFREARSERQDGLVPRKQRKISSIRGQNTIRKFEIRDQMLKSYFKANARRRLLTFKTLKA